MTKAGDRRAAVVAGGRRSFAGEQLPFVIELWNLPKTEIERTIARADTLEVARAIFRAAVSENPARRVVLRQGERILEERN